MTGQLRIRIISAGAGSGKTHRLTSELIEQLRSGVRAGGIIATTFTQKAASELQERVRVRLLKEGLRAQADEINNALIGTVHGLGVRLLRRFAYEAGVSPQVDIIAEEDQQMMFNQALSNVLSTDRIAGMEILCERLGLNKRGTFDWRREVKSLTDVARANDFDTATLERSRQLSFSEFQAFLKSPVQSSFEALNQQLAVALEKSLEQIEAADDATKKTQTVIDTIRQTQRDLRLKGEIPWHQWVKLTKLDPGAKSRDAIADLVETARLHEQHPVFQQDIASFIHQIFDIAIEALQEFAQYKKSRGLIDYTDMESLVYRLLDHPQVQEVLAEELDLLLVDEFQDTNPLQLAIFLKLSQYAKAAIWVGDPKQSIYGFRGAEPRLMEAIIQHAGGVKPQDIQQYSWRSRRDIVYAVNSIFTKAFHTLPPEQVALHPKRDAAEEPTEADSALVHWHFVPEEEGRPPARPWFENCLAETLRHWLASKQHWVLPKGESAWRPARPSDVAILCRNNDDCQEVAQALHRAGLRAALARTGLLQTAETKLVLACLKYMLNTYDSLSVAEILLLAEGQSIEAIVEDRLLFLEQQQSEDTPRGRWSEQSPLVGALLQLRSRVFELSASEMLNTLVENLDLRRIIAAWGNVDQRLDNLEALRKLAQQYEEACHRTQSAATLGGWLLWLNEMEMNRRDYQGSGEGPDAINVLTYHKSKGLEWPVAICHNLDERLRAEVWGMDIVANDPEVRLNDVLGGRWLRYWVNPYADQFQNTGLAERIEQSEAKKQKTEQALQEEARLLYVGLTRARDILILPSGPRPTSWLNRVFNDGNEDIPTLDPHSSDSPWHWNGLFLNIDTTIHKHPRSFGYIERNLQAVNFLESRKGRGDYLPYKIDLRRKGHGIQAVCRVSNSYTYSKALEIGDLSRAYEAAKLAKAFLTAWHSHYSQNENNNIAKSLSQRFGQGQLIEDKALMDWGRHWEQWLRHAFTPKQTLRKFPLSITYQGQLFETIADLILVCEGQIILIQHSGFSGDDKNREKKAIEELGPWFYLCKLAIKAHFNVSEVRTLAHFVLSSYVVELSVQ